MSRCAQLSVFVVLFLMAAVVYYWQSLSYHSSKLPNGASYTPVDCWFNHQDVIRIECGYMTTRQTGTSAATFDLPVVILRHSFWKNSGAPMLHIAGGPGGAAYLDPEVMPFWIQNFIDQDWGVDFVLYDQRGAGLSKPGLRCPNTNTQRLRSLQQPLTASQDAAQFSEQMRSCYQYFSKQNAVKNHLRLISTDNSVDDIADLHDLLGVDQWVLMGVSYGTRLALEVVRRHPEYVDSMILDSVYPPEFDGFETLTENGLKAIQRLVDSCHLDAICEEQFPMLSELLYQALMALNDKPIPLIVPREVADKPARPMLLTTHRLILLLDYASYDARLMVDVPAAISAVLEEDANNKSLLKLASNYLEIELFDEFSEPVYMITECRENGQFNIAELMERLKPYQEAFPMLDWSEKAVFDPSICSLWETVSDSPVRAYREPVNSSIPALILAGTLDSITPPEWGRSLAKKLSQSRYLEYPNAGHSVLTSSICSNDEVQLFINPKLEKTAFCDLNERMDERIHHMLSWVY